VKSARARHKARHRPTGLGFALADSVSYIAPEPWDEVTRGSSLFLGRSYLAALEAEGSEDVVSRYALVFHGPKPVAAVAAQLIRISAEKLARLEAPSEPDAKHKDDPVSRAFVHARAKVMSKLRLGALKRVKARVLVCGNVFSWGMHGVAFASGEDRAALWPAVAEALYRIRRAEKLSGQMDLILIKDLPAGDEGARALKTFSYRPLETEPDMVLKIPPAWRSYEDYLASLSSRYRKTAQRIAKDFGDGGFRVERLEALEPHAVRLHELYREVHDEAKVRLAAIRPGLLPALARALGGDFRCTVARRGSEIVGFVTTLRDGDRAIGYYIGFDRAVNSEAPVYFRLLQSVVADAIELGVRELSLGRTALEPKARLGARAAPLEVWIRHRVPVLNLLVRSLLGTVPHAEAPERDPFKVQ